MAKYEVLRAFPAKNVIGRGQVIENPVFRNLGTLVRTGYLREITEETLPEISESVSTIKRGSLKKRKKKWQQIKLPAARL